MGRPPGRPDASRSACPRWAPSSTPRPSRPRRTWSRGRSASPRGATPARSWSPGSTLGATGCRGGCGASSSTSRHAPRRRSAPSRWSAPCSRTRATASPWAGSPRLRGARRSVVRWPSPYVHRSVEVPGQVSVVGGGSVVELPDPSDLAEQAPEPEPGQVPVIGRAEVRELPLVGGVRGRPRYGHPNRRRYCGTGMPTYLSEIVAAHRGEAARDRRELSELVARALAAPARGDSARPSPEREGSASSPRSSAAHRPRATWRRTSIPGATAAPTRAGGAACLSVLTDADYFGGSPADLAAAQAADRPAGAAQGLHRVAPTTSCDARLMGADAVLLIVAALDDDELRRPARPGRPSRARRALVEVHDEAELARALELGAALVGREPARPRTPSRSTSERAERLAPAIPDDVVAVAESGIRDPADAAPAGRRRLPGGPRRRDPGALRRPCRDGGWAGGPSGGAEDRAGRRRP